MRVLGIVLPALALAVIGLLFVQSAAGSDYFVLRQAKWLVVASFAFGAVLLMPGPWFEKSALLLYAACIVLLALVPLVGHEAGRAVRWIRLGGFTIQPSEFSKPALILALARALRRRRNLEDWTGLVEPLVLTAIPILFIVKQPDLGTALTLLPIVGAMFFAAGMRRRHIRNLAVVLVLSAPLLWCFVMTPVQKARVLSFLWPAGHEVGWNYQREQSRIAVGSGGALGKGRGEGTQSRLNFLPERHTDFIFAVIAEEWGLAGCLSVLALYGALLSSMMSVARSTRDPFGRLVCVGVAALFAVQVFVNTGMNVGMLPVTGLTLPLVSYGGSSLVTFAAALALVVSVSRNRSPVLAVDGFA